ncbi:MAG: symmetrical bis(5'-nucleosyl)-tetraphosphatase [Psychrobium sp.]
MATYFIGDLQACFDEFILLLEQIEFDHQQDQLYLVGDLIGRGPKPKETLDYLIQHQFSIKSVLGNHDLHFLAVANNIKTNKDNDNFSPLLESARLNDYINYLRAQPLIRLLKDNELVVCHAGITPQWSLETAVTQASRVNAKLTSPHYKDLLEAMYNNIADWQQCKTQQDELIFAINTLTRMRYCNEQGHLEFMTKVAPEENSNPTLTPWFNQQHSLISNQKIIFGHWASILGNTNHPQFIALDTGCLWGNWLTCWRYEDNSFFYQKSL